MNDVEWNEAVNRSCPWDYPDPPHPACGAPARVPVAYRVSGTVVWYCLNHAQREVLGGQATYLHLHHGDPCQQCGIAHDDVPPGPCLGAAR